MKLIFKHCKSKLYLVENVYPKIDQLNVEPTRKVIQDVFEEHITHAPGMKKVRDMVNGNIIPTPAGVMEATKLFYEILGDVVTVDVGGATTDIHSVTEGNEEISSLMISPEPMAKRTVEGDLGVYLNVHNIIELTTLDKLAKRINISIEELEDLINNPKPIPQTDIEKKFVEELAMIACETAMDRHVGSMIDLYSTTGKKRIAQGKDLTAVKYIVGTGGALTKLPKRVEILEKMLGLNRGLKLTPNDNATILIDNDYIMASIGVLSKTHRDESIKLLRQSLKL
jgi:uncharacterized protein (TIGR01319 family)